jgi:hypothetical protein
MVCSATRSSVVGSTKLMSPLMRNRRIVAIADRPDDGVGSAEC